MFDLIKAVFAQHRGAVSALALLHIFTFIPAAMVFWLENDPAHHLVYYAFIAAVAAITSWVLSAITKGAKPDVNHYVIKMEVTFVLLALIVAPFLLTFYLKTAVFFANSFGQVYPDVYTGPNRAVSATVVFLFYNLFFYKDLFAGLIKKKTTALPSQPYQR